MATVAAFPSLYSCSISTTNYSSLSFVRLVRRKKLNTSTIVNRSESCLTNKKVPLRIRAVEEETLIPEEEEEEEEDVKEEEEASVTEQPVSVPVSPSDILTMFFQAEGAMDESLVTKVSKALEEVEGVSDLKVRVLEGIASVELKSRPQSKLQEWLQI